MNINEINETDVKTAVVVLVSPYVLFLVPIREDDFQRLKDCGCLFTTSDASQISDLLTILKRSILSDAPSAASGKIEPRCGVFLTMTDGQEIVLQFQQKYRAMDVVRGVLSSVADGKKTSISAGLSLPDDLFYWAAEVGNPQSVPQFQQECSTWFDKANLESPWKTKSIRTSRT